MASLKRTVTTLIAAAMLASPAAVAHANLSAAQKAAFGGKSGITVLSSDGDYVGTTTGINIQEDQTKIFVRPLRGSILRKYNGSLDVFIITSTDQLSISGNNLVLASSSQRVKNKVRYSATDDPPQAKIYLTGLRQ